MLVQTDTRISLKGSFIMSTIMVELIELKWKRLIQVTLSNSWQHQHVFNVAHIKADGTEVPEKVSTLKLMFLWSALMLATSKIVQGKLDHNQDLSRV